MPDIESVSDPGVVQVVSDVSIVSPDQSLSTEAAVCSPGGSNSSLLRFLSRVPIAWYYTLALLELVYIGLQHIYRSSLPLEISTASSLSSIQLVVACLLSHLPRDTRYSSSVRRAMKRKETIDVYNMYLA